jgi:hypothetical protein
MQLWHEGAIRKEGGNGPYSQYPTLSPSGLAHAGKPNGRPATLEEMEAIKAAFVKGALAAQQLGACGVEVHACHGYLLDQFLWAETNRRADGYGGHDMAARVRFPAEIVRAIARQIGAAIRCSSSIILRMYQARSLGRAIVVLATTATVGFAQDAGLMRADSAFVEAVTNADKAAFEKLLDADFTWTDGDGKVQTKAQILRERPRMHIAHAKDSESKASASWAMSR